MAPVEKGPHVERVHARHKSARRLLLRPLLSPEQFLPGLALALAIGLLIGVERGWQLRGEEPGGRVAGIRTFALLGLLGGLVGLELPTTASFVAILMALGAVAALLLG